jgi:hypothetical protein
MTSSILTDYLGQGLASARPTTPPIATTALALYYADDTGVLSLWDTQTSAWVTVVGGGTALSAVGTGLTITSPGTVALDPLGTGLSISGGTINAQWSGGAITTVGPGLHTASNTLAANWNGGTVNALGTGLAISGGSLVPNWEAGTITTVGAGLFTSANTLEANWNGGTVTTLGSGLSLTGGTLIATGGGGGGVSTIVAGGGLTGGTITTSGTIAANWNGGTVTSLGSGLTLSGGTLSASGGGGTTLPFFNIAAGVPSLSSFTQVNVSGTTSIAQSSTEKVITLSDTGANLFDLRGITYPAPSTPYRIAMLVCDDPGITPQRGLVWGFSDGTKYQVLYRFNSSSGLYLVDFSDANTEAGASSQPSPPVFTGGAQIWLGCHNDGTNIYYEMSTDGVVWSTIYSTTIAGNYITTIASVFVGISPQSTATPSAFSIQCFDPNGLTRAFT